jgi:hypothetical protein
MAMEWNGVDWTAVDMLICSPLFLPSPHPLSSLLLTFLALQDDLDILKGLRRTRSFRNSTCGCSLRPGSPGLKRRNSTGTIYLGTTMSTQDNQVRISAAQCL